ncbi:EAL domain-containing protein [Deinococcus soli (ex Cha et al. 2016)]|uniref:Diguanylate cyclase n=1 Tax=Deinococcus soli (ex Cha et al. 2016) TaxID=1309411 RepID=A0A0F7JL00_9DEIO|nr:EAL domain-containing protein [Deinococcus soli (ex Cha et al. 2016)]AKH16004.1 hypothetical protein SY84_01900 [Deinococcus soli (ex Cha et al. 2016)]
MTQQEVNSPLRAPPGSLERDLAALEAGMYHTPEVTSAQIAALLAQATQRGDTRAQLLAYLLLGGCALYTGRLPDVKAHLDAALTLARQVADPLMEARSLNGLGLYHDRVAQYDLALQAFLDSLRLTQASGDDTGSFRALTNLAALYTTTGQLSQALAFHDRAQQLAQVLQSPIILASSITHLILIHDRQDHPAQVLDLAGEHLPLIRQVGPPRWVSTVQECVSRALLRQGHTGQALTVALTDLDATRARQDREGISRLACAAALAHLALGNLEEAGALLRESLECSREVGSRPVEILALDGLVRLHEWAGDHRAALAYAREHHALERAVHEHEVDARSQLLTAEIRLELLNREAEIERLRNVDLARANRQLRDTQADLLHRATHDALTGVSNRAHFQQVTTDTLRSLGSGENAALIFIDLDRFKTVNDTLGHSAGDSLLQQVARRLQSVVRSSDLVGRVGGDEFTVLLSRVSARRDATLVAQKLADVLTDPFDLAGTRMTITASIGCAVAPSDGRDAEALQQHADLAMYRVKRSGGNQVLHFESAMGEPGDRQLLERDLRGALDRQELRLHYQGRYAVRGGALAGFEALIRWEHPERGLIPPVTFIPVAEDTRLILPIGEWVLREACAQAVRWAFPQRGLCMSVNVSPLQFDLPHFVDTVRAALRATGLPARHLILEITESLVMRDLERAQSHVTELKALGVQIAMDDFGTGYSSLSMLESLPFDQLKVDRSFTRHLNTDRQPRVTALMGAMIQLAQTLNMTVTVEGVEDDSQRDRLRDLGCDHIQGFLLARPLPPEAAKYLLTGAVPGDEPPTRH